MIEAVTTAPTELQKTRRQKMRSLATKQYGKPQGYEILDLPIPEIKNPDEVLIKVHASSINPVDTHVATGLAKAFIPSPLPFKLGYDVSGTIEAVGSAVSGDLKPGMEVYSRVPEEYRGTASEFVVSTDKTTAQKPSSLSHVESASLPLVALTALRVLDIAEKHVPGGLKGKTVLIPAGLSGVGSIAIQLAKRVFHAGKVITTLSTAKITKVDNLLGEGLLDQIVDYTKDSPVKTIAAGSVDFMFDITDEAMAFLPLMKKGGLILTVAGVPFGDSLRETMPNMPFLPRYCLLAYGSYLQFRAGRYGVSFHHVFMRPSAEDLARLRGWVDQGIVKPLVGKTAPLEDIKAIREACEGIHSGKGGTGKFVIVVQN